MIESKEQPGNESTAAYTSTPPFDPEKYRTYLEDTELSEEQQVEYLKVLWSIMITFVDLGFGVDSVQQVLGDSSAHTTTNGTVRGEMGSYLLPGISRQAEK